MPPRSPGGGPAAQRPKGRAPHRTNTNGEWKRRRVAGDSRAPAAGRSPRGRAPAHRPAPRTSSGNGLSVRWLSGSLRRQLHLLGLGLRAGYLDALGVEEAVIGLVEA